MVMSTYKEPEGLLRQAVESILGQTYKDFEFVIILDCPDNELHKGVIRDYQKKDDRIKFYINEKNMGLAASLNKGIEKSTGTYICRMDADDISLPRRLELQKKYLEEKKADLMGGLTQVIDETGELLYSIHHIPEQHDEILKALRYNQVLPHPTWFGRRRVFEALKGYRQIPLCEDSDFTLRAALRGFRLSNLNETVLQYRMSKKSISRDHLFEQYLYLRYITSQYRKGKVTDVEAVKTYVASKNKTSVARRYGRANARFNALLKDLEEKKILSFFIDGVCFTFTSCYYLDKVYRLARVSLYK